MSTMHAGVASIVAIVVILFICYGLSTALSIQLGAQPENNCTIQIDDKTVEIGGKIALAETFYYIRSGNTVYVTEWLIYSQLEIDKTYEVATRKGTSEYREITEIIGAV